MNVCGLKSKLRFEEFHDIIKGYDIFICIETKIDKFDILNLPDGYSEFSKYRRKHFKKKSGGISELFSKMYLKNVLILLKLTVILFFRLESTLFLKIIIYYVDVYTMYIPPENSKY